MPDQQALDTCILSGFPPEVDWVAQFTVVGVSGSADYGDGPEMGDLHNTFFDGPIPTTEEFILCIDSVSNPGTITDDSAFKTLLNLDALAEPEEFAEFQIFDQDLDGNLTLHDSIDIFVEDSGFNAGELSICCFLAVGEFETPANITVSRSGGSAGAVSVDYTTGAFAGTALPGEDFQATAGTLHWSDGDMSDKFIQVPIINDLVYEDLEYFYVDLVSPMGGATLDPEAFFVEIDILDDDPPPSVLINSFTASPNPIGVGQSTTLSWSVSNADSCIASGGAGGWAGSLISLPSGSQSVTLSSPGSYTFTLQCSDSFESSDTAMTMVSVEANPAVMINSFSASPNPIGVGQSTTLSWSVSNADSCIASGGAGGWAGSLISLPSGSQSVTLSSPGSYTFTLQCSNSFESSDTAMTMVSVEANPAVIINSFAASPNPVDEGQSTTLSWSVSNADSCTASGGAGGWAGSLISLPSGSQSVTLSSPGSYTFTLQCSNSFESSDTAMTMVSVEANPAVIINSFAASPNPVDEGQSTTLSWSVSNADSCTASGGAGGWAGSLISLPSGSRTLTLSEAGNFDFVLQCSGASESFDSANIVVTVMGISEPNLAASNVTTDKTTFASGGELTVGATVTNIGTTTANSSTIRYYLSTNNTINSSDIPLGTSTSPVLGVGNSHVAQFQGDGFS